MIETKLSETTIETTEMKPAEVSLVGTTPIATIALTNATMILEISPTEVKLTEQTTSQDPKTGKINPATTKVIRGADAECSNGAKHV